MIYFFPSQAEDDVNDGSCFCEGSAPLQWKIWYRSAPTLKIPAGTAICIGCEVMPGLWSDTAGYKATDTLRFGTSLELFNKEHNGDQLFFLYLVHM